MVIEAAEVRTRDLAPESPSGKAETASELDCVVVRERARGQRRRDGGEPNLHLARLHRGHEVLGANLAVQGGSYAEHVLGVSCRRRFMGAK